MASTGHRRACKTRRGDKQAGCPWPMQTVRFVTRPRCLYEHTAFAPPLNLRVDLVSFFSGLVGRLMRCHVLPKPILCVRELHAVRLGERFQLRSGRRAQ